MNENEYAKTPDSAEAESEEDVSEGDLIQVKFKRVFLNLFIDIENTMI